MLIDLAILATLFQADYANEPIRYGPNMLNNLPKACQHKIVSLVIKRCCPSPMQKGKKYEFSFL